jgi:Circularly permutated YpsA SLOG family
MFGCQPAILPLMRTLLIISGGQTGVDRAALDAAIARGIDYGGWCPRGGWAEDMTEPPGLLVKYPHLRETPSADPAQRTEWNVRDVDACLILVDAGGVASSKGTALAETLAARYGKLLKVIDVGARDAPAQARAWLDVLLAAHTGNAPFRLAIGGPRESEAPGIYEKARAVLRGAINPVIPGRA